jgi:Fe-S-cluster containining protein
MLSTGMPFGTAPGPRPADTAAGNVIFEVDIATSHGRLQTVLEFSESEIRFSDLAREALFLGDKIVDMVVAAKAREGRAVSCTRGCTSCCRQAVAVSPPEALLIAEVISSFPQDRREVLAERFVSARGRYADSGLEKWIRSPESEATKALSFAFGYHKLGIDCPFLEDGSCSIYAQRPFDCRNYLVSSPASLCSDLKKDSGIEPMRTRESIALVLTALAAEMLGGPPHMLLVLDIPEWNRLNRAWGRRKFPAGLLVGRFLELLEKQYPSPSVP